MKLNKVFFLPAYQQGLFLQADQFERISNTEKIIKISKSWINSIQFTEPRGSLDNVDELIEDIASTYLRELHSESEPKNKGRDRKVAARIVKSTTRKILKQELGEEAKELLKSDYEIPGRHKTNRFDVVIANGRPYFAAHGISFEVDVPDRLTDAILWRISDVKYNQSDFPLGILILPPKAEQHNYNELQKVYLKTIDTYKELGADIVRENEVESWVEDQIVNIPF